MNVEIFLKTFLPTQRVTQKFCELYETFFSTPRYQQGIFNEDKTEL